MLAALAAVEDKTQEFESEVAKVLAVSPGHGEVYRVAGELVARNYRFEEAVVLTRRALTLAPNDARALAELGAQLLRTGDEAEARTALEASFKIDAFDVVTLNALRLLDSLDKFETIRDGDLILKLSKEEAPVMKEYVVGARARGARDDGQAVRVHAEGPDPDRDVSQARRLRRQDGRAAGHDRRARRLFRPRRDARFAEGPAAG